MPAPSFISLRQPLQLAYLAVEQPPRDEAEAALLQRVRAFVAAAAPLTDLRDLAPQVGQQLGEGYQVYSGGSHTAIHRQGSTERLAIIADAETTSYRDWDVPAPQLPVR